MDNAFIAAMQQTVLAHLIAYRDLILSARDSMTPKEKMQTHLWVEDCNQCIERIKGHISPRRHKLGKGDIA